jgi:imidazolonepropionase-like amidohydrolase
VTSQARAGADLIKVFVTGGNLTPNTDPFALQYSAERLTVAVNAAHEHGLRVAAHAHAPAGIRVAVEAGVDTIEHCLFETPAGVAYDEAVVDRIAAQGIVVSPTVGNPPAATAEESEALIVADPAWQRLFERLSEFRRNFRRMFDAGVVLAGGSDAGIARRTFDHYPFDVAAMADGAPAHVGLSRLDALRAATSVAAEVCGLGATGRLASRHRADLLAVGGNPLARIGDLRDVRLVVCGGRLVIGRSEAA